MTEHFTEPARRVLSRAREEARELRHSFVGTEHLLLALLHDDRGGAAAALQRSGVTYAQVRAAVVRMMGLGAEPGGEDVLDFTGRAEDAIEAARQRASAAGHEQAGTEHILLALMSERDGAAVRILQQLDVDPAAIRAALAS